MRILYLHGFGSSPATSFKSAWFRNRFKDLGVEMEAPQLVPDFFNITLSGQLNVLGDVLGSDPCRLIGSSLGGLVASLYAQANPEQVDAMVLLAPAFGFPARWVERMGEEGLAQWRSSGELIAFHHATQKEEPVSFNFYTDALQYDPEPAFSPPATILHGVNDETVSIEYSRRFADGKDHVDLVELDDDHSLCSDAAALAMWDAVERRFGL